MKTPWGDTHELHGARLHPGVQPNGRAATERHQRRRMFAWMVATTGRAGYSAAKIERLRQESGVARSVFYSHFETKEECFLAAIDALYEQGLQRIEAAYRSKRSPKAALRAAFAEVAELALSQPYAARMALVHVYEVGEPGRTRIDRAADRCERQLEAGLARIPQRSGLPAHLPAAIIGASQMLIHDRLRRDLEDELPLVAQQLCDLALSYTAPPSPLPRPRTRVSPAPRQHDPDPGARLLYAIAELSAQKGYRNVSVNDLAPHAHTSLRTVYDRYGGKEQCFLAAFEMTRARTLEHALAAFEPLMPDWPQALHAAFAAIMRYFASEPDLARLVMVEVLAAGPIAFERRDEGIRSFVRLFEPGYDRAAHAPKIAAEAIPFGVYALVHRHLVQGRPAASLPQLVPDATFFALAPAIGTERAAEIARSRIPAPQRPTPRKPIMAHRTMIARRRATPQPG